MRRPILTLLTVFMLLTQLGLIAHSWQNHDSHDNCELCLAANQFDHAIITDQPPLSFDNTFDRESASNQQIHALITTTFYAIRAPPTFL